MFEARDPPWNSPPFALLAACCRRPATSERDSAIRRLAAGVDWSAFAALSKRHRVEGLARDALRVAGVGLPAKIDACLAERANEIAVHGLVLAAEAARLQGVLDQAEIPNLLLKGTALEVLAYGRLGLKSAWDIDLLVPPSAATRARQALEAAGYDLRDPGQATEAAFERWTNLAKESVFAGRANGVVVELHWALVDGDLLPSIGTNSPAQWVPIVGGTSLRTLATDELLAYLMVHGTSHGWSRLKWLADLNAILPQGDPAALDEVHRRAVEIGAGACPSVAITLCRRLFDLEVSPALARTLDRSLKVRLLERVALDALTGGDGVELADRPFAEDRILMSRLLFGHGWRWRRREFVRQWTSVHDQTRLNLPRRLRFLYGVIRAPSWIWRRVRRP